MKKLYLLLTILLCSLGFILPSCGDDDNDSFDNGRGSIYGIVTVDGEPLKGIGVSLYVDYNTLLLKTVTYADGSYEFSDLTEGYYTLIVEDEQFENFKTDIYVESGRQARADMKLTRIQTDMTVTTLDATVLGPNVELRGSWYTSNSNREASECGFYYSVDRDPRSGQRLAAQNVKRNFDASITNLKPGTYYYQAYARNSIGTTYGNVISFIITGEPVIETKEATEVGENSAMLNGNVVYAGNPKYDERGFIYSDSYPTPTVENGVSIKVSGTGEGSFKYTLSSLLTNTTYYYRAYLKQAILS